MLAEKEENSIKRSVVDRNLKQLIANNESIYAVVLSSIDGHAIANQAQDHFEDSKLAAMTSSCLALGEKIALEANQKGCDFVIIQNQDGFLALKRVGRKLVLTTLADKSINMGMLLSATRTAADALYKEIT
ncbi:MAG: roadblock/LC7 domain-containing protein [Ketobacter sp.]|jgi:uncharacterized protein|uniref:roadblock/LC7 domain-containing protein n=1 Tax=unclassified Ketobacter TaxID=2639109 RepID=UPI0025C0B952|nr:MULTISPECIES: roadblock/LC7 domain-containing protein [unclassified Ketobacter]MEC8811613.1 roadblock/LC7 domain-containing protein [Pseudomonadota bacterium]|tara:strand:+ start:808 stop:1200 length:393 start_codon:yes stop_codon:yes gene_type:complete